MIEEECRVSLYQDYVATGIKIIAEAYVKCHNGDLRLPSFIEMTHEKEKEETAQDIKDRIVRQLTEG